MIATLLLLLAATAGEWQPLFEKLPEDAAGWSFENGELHALPSTPFRTRDLYSANRYSNFEFVVEYRVSPGGNSGIRYLPLPGRIAGAQFPTFVLSLAAVLAGHSPVAPEMARLDRGNYAACANSSDSLLSGQSSARSGIPGSRQRASPRWQTRSAVSRRRPLRSQPCGPELFPPCRRMERGAHCGLRQTDTTLAQRYVGGGCRHGFTLPRRSPRLLLYARPLRGFQLGRMAQARLAAPIADWLAASRRRSMVPRTEGPGTRLRGTLTLNRTEVRPAGR